MRNILAQYWGYNQCGGGVYKWKTLQHNGVLFPPEYIPHNIPILYDNNEMRLDPIAEEYATLYAKYIDTPYIKIPDFNINFWEDWSEILGPTSPIKSLEKCNFSNISKHLLKQKENAKQLTKEEKEKIKQEKDNFEQKFKIAIVDGKEQPVGNFRIESPGIFIGRGCHPKLGKIKKRIYPQDIIINIGREASVPDPLLSFYSNKTGEQMEEHLKKKYKWADIVHDRSVEWLASWKDEITGKIKYIWLGSHSDLRKKSDIEKFELARKLKRKINNIRAQYSKDLFSEDLKIRQCATALYFIDQLALRVGNEKSDDEADTVGVSSLRVEHIKLHEGIVLLDFLGKDSVRYKRKFVPASEVYANLEIFMQGKSRQDDLFDQVTPNDINKYLQQFMKGLTTKIFRTYNASNLLYKELQKLGKKYADYDKDDLIDVLLDGFNKANAKVAILCNHQKNISKSFESQIDKLTQKMDALKKKINGATGERKQKLKSKLNALKVKKALKIELKDISLGTSKVNYIDPRISVAFLKKFNIPLDRIFSETLQEKFGWAFNVNKDFVF